MVQQREHDAQVLSYRHIRELPRADEALHSLRKIASLVKPIMRARGWKVSELCEFYPSQQNLLGLNVNRGQKIMLRLRYPGDRSQFLPIEQVTDTMLHELAHIVHGPHDAKFHALWDQLRDEHEGLAMKGYTGEGFLSQGHKLGGRTGVPPQEARRLARAAAEERARQAERSRGSGQRLGGAPIHRGQDIRQVITNAVERRNRMDRGCASTNYTDQEIHNIAETATKNGFRTQAEEDAANEAAIAQALWELVQEDEKRIHGKDYVPPSPDFPAGNGGGAFTSTSRNRESSSIPPPVPEWSRPEKPGTPTSASPEPDLDLSPSLPATNGWTCEICTLHNPPSFLSCDACGTTRPESVTRQLAEQEARERAAKRPRPTPAVRSQHGPSFWECSRCGHVVERQWWSCGQCGNVKESSK
ncbi:WLM-domain-containing protein [Cryphonectria parasitica EP155]|uniref:WLM-domain-containing protein n=1 Tax=Cryphonectria parasitica (strain ATCC 38755 / EP155) TaxID=660469 RepID=A0A9P4Y0Q9_CRYP1|nr:WLM-domain-containing protein [Cryphonectria parasitica EP155]KAF3764384.1 WLM-domain-containing protein [Cryphonectria parasitica EP155]